MPRETPWFYALVKGRERKNMDTREKHSIVAQVAAKVAGSMCCGNPDVNVYLATVETVHNDLMERVVMGDIADVFPGATAVAAPAAAPVAAPVAAAAPPPGPTQQSVVAAPAARGPQLGQKIYPRVDFCVGKQSDEKQQKARKAASGKPAQKSGTSNHYSQAKKKVTDSKKKKK